MTNSDSMYSSPFSPINLSKEEKDQLSRYAEDLVQSHLRAYEDYLNKSGENLSDKTKWRQIRQVENVHVHENRPDVSLWSKFFSKDHKPDPKADPTDETEGIVDMRGTGTINGTLDDFMNGATSTSLEDFRLKSSYVEDNSKRMCILLPVKPATPDNPYETLVIKYRSLNFDGLINYVVKDLDFVFIDYSGIRKLPNGERVGFLLAHSISFPSTSPLDSASRSKIALCYMARQKSEGVLEVYTRGMAESPSKIWRPVVSSVYSKLIANTTARHVECGIMKKLSWLVHLRSKETRHPDGSKDSCTVCSSKLRSSAKACRLCYRSLCSSCQVKKSMFVINPDDQLTKMSMVFCSPCLCEAVRMDAGALRGDEIRAKMSMDASSAHMSAFLAQNSSFSSSS